MTHSRLYTPLCTLKQLSGLHLCNITNTLERKFEQKSVRLRANIFVLLAQNDCVEGMSVAGDWAQPGNNKDTPKSFIIKMFKKCFSSILHWQHSLIAICHVLHEQNLNFCLCWFAFCWFAVQEAMASFAFPDKIGYWELLFYISSYIIKNGQTAASAAQQSRVPKRPFPLQ